MIIEKDLKLQLNFFNTNQYKQEKLSSLYLKKKLKNYLIKTKRILLQDDIDRLRNITVRSSNHLVIEYYRILKQINKKKNWNLDIFRRNQRAAKYLLMLTQNNLERTLRAVDIISIWTKKSNLNWTLETVVKWLPYFLVGNLKIGTKIIPPDVIIYNNNFCEEYKQLSPDGSNVVTELVPMRFEN